MTYETLIYEKRDGVGILQLNRPERYNAMNYQLNHEISTLLDEVAVDSDVKSLIVTGGEKAFSAGADLKDLNGEPPPDFLKRANEMINKLEHLPKPTVAAIRGLALGGGCELALVCDLRVAAEDARIGVPEVKIGVIPAAGGTQRLPRLLGPARAKEMLMTGEPISGTEAARLGLVNRAVPAEQVLDESMKLASALASRPPLALSAIKDCVNLGLQMDLASALDYEAKCVDILKKSEDYREGVSAFVEKRKPHYVGR